MKLIQKLIDEKLLVEHTSYSNRPSLSQTKDQQKIFLGGRREYQKLQIGS